MTASAVVVTYLRDNRDTWVTADQLSDTTPGMTRQNANRYLPPLYHAGVLERELVPGTGRYRYKWLGAGPGGVR